VTSTVAPVHDVHVSAGATRSLRVPWRRLAALVAMIGLPTALGVVARHPDARPATTLLFHYSPDRLVHGRVWTLVLSGLLPPKLGSVGPTTIAMTLILVPYVVLRGAWRAMGRFLGGHVVATLAVAALVLPGAALGWRFATDVTRAPDYGVSAGLAGVAGAMGVVLWRRRWPIPAGVLLAGVCGFFVYQLLATNSLVHHLSESEHLIAATVGIVLEWRSA
jgi:hypothetical protein